MAATAKRGVDTPHKRSRLAPEKRRALILDHTAEIIASEGVSALSMDRIGREAGISLGLPVSAGALLLHGHMSREVLEDLTVTMIIGTFTELKREHVAKRRIVPRQTQTG